MKVKLALCTLSYAYSILWGHSLRVVFEGVAQLVGCGTVGRVGHSWCGTVGVAQLVGCGTVGRVGHSWCGTVGRVWHSW